MKKVDKFVLKSFIGPLVLTFFIVLFILIMQFLWMYIDELVGKGLEPKVLAELLFQFSLTFVPTALPLAILLAALMTFGNMGEYSELAALKSSGVSLQRIMRSLIILMAVISLSAFLFSNYVVPYSNKKARSLLFDIRRKRPDINLQAGTFNYDIEGFSIKVGEKDPETNRLDNVMIYDHREERGNVSVIYADSGYIRISPDNTAMIMTLFNGYSSYEIEEDEKLPDKRRYPSRRDHFEEQSIVLALSGFDLERSGDNLFRSTSWMLKMGELSYFIDSLTVIMNNRFEDYWNDYMQNQIYSGRINPEAYNTDDIIDKRVPKETSFIADSIYRALSIVDKEAAIAYTLEDVKKASTFVDERTDAMIINMKSVSDYKQDWHKKLTLPFACLIFFFIGAPLGAIIRKGGLGTPSVISVLFFVIWYVLSLIGEKMVEGNIIHPIIGMWASSYILLPIGILLTYKASTDSVMMNIDTYINVLKNIFNRLGPTPGKTKVKKSK